MKHRLGRLVATLALVVGTLAASPTAAHANHANVLGHWNQPPLVVTNSNPVYDSLIQDAAFYWQDVAFFRGYYPPLPSKEAANSCENPNVGRIVVCMVAPNDVGHLGAGNRGNTRTTKYGDGSGHILGQIIYVSTGLTGSDMQNTMRHEFGHALGLHHYDGAGHPVACDVMNASACGPYSGGIDQFGIYSWQPYTYSWQSAWHNQH